MPLEPEPELQAPGVLEVEVGSTGGDAGRSEPEPKEASFQKDGSLGQQGSSREGPPPNGACVSILFSRVHADNLANVDEDKDGRKGASDPYVVFSENGVRLAKTEVLRDTMGHSGTAKPVWGGEYAARLAGAAPGAQLDVEIFDYDRKGIHVSLGKASFSVGMGVGDEIVGYTQEYALKLREVPDGRASEVGFRLRLGLRAAEADAQQQRRSCEGGKSEAVGEAKGRRRGSSDDAPRKSSSGDVPREPSKGEKPRTRPSKKEPGAETEGGAVLRQKNKGLSKKGRTKRSSASPQTDRPPPPNVGDGQAARDRPGSQQSSGAAGPGEAGPAGPAGPAGEAGAAGEWQNDDPYAA